MNSLKGLRILFALFVVIGGLTAAGNFFTGKFYQAGLDGLGTGLWLAFYVVATWVQYRREAERGPVGWQ